eukprot:scaffold421220_cov42-Attheya_sp.AAC.4
MVENRQQSRFGVRCVALRYAHKCVLCTRPAFSVLEASESEGKREINRAHVSTDSTRHDTNQQDDVSKWYASSSSHAVSSLWDDQCRYTTQDSAGIDRHEL